MKLLFPIVTALFITIPLSILAYKATPNAPTVSAVGGILTALTSSGIEIQRLREAKDDSPSNVGLAGYAKLLCSAVFITNYSDTLAREHSLRVASALMRMPDADLEQVTETINHNEKLVTASLGNTLTRTAKYYGDQGCIIHPDDHDGIYFTPRPVKTVLPDRDITPWPMGDVLPDDPLPPEIDKDKLNTAVELAFESPSRVSALVVVYKDRLVAERYAPGITKDTLLENWSMGKSLTATLIGRLMQDEYLGLDDLAPVPAWQEMNDPRRNIRISDLLRMSSGLKFSLYDVLKKTPDGRSVVGDVYPDHYYVYSGATDVFRYVVSRPLEHKPGTVGRYRNTDPLTLGYIVKRTVEAQNRDYLSYPQSGLFDEIGIRDLVLETDPYGNFVSSGYELGRARDWARLGLLYLQNGTWLGKQLLPKEFVDFVRTPAPAWENEEGQPSVSRYGGMWWLNTTSNWNAPKDAYYAAGAGGQSTLVIPSRNIVIARLTDYDNSIPNISKAKTNAAVKAILEAIADQ